MGKRGTLSTFIESANRVHGNRYDYSEVNYVNNHTKIVVICNIHGSWLVRPNDHTSSRSGCPSCSKLESRMTNSTFVISARKVHKDKYDYSFVEVVDYVTDVGIICKTHGIFHQSPKNHIANRHGCFRCYCDSNRDTVLQFAAKSRKIHGDSKYDYSAVEYVNTLTPVIIICSLHGQFIQSPHNHLNKSHGCPRCAVSNTSTSEQEWLNCCNVPNTNRQVLIWCNGKRMKVDGFDPNTNTVYEFYGDYWHGNPLVFDPDHINKTNYKTFGHLHNATQCRRHNLISAGYNLVEIWEADWIKLRKTLKKDQV